VRHHFHVGIAFANVILSAETPTDRIVLSQVS
jgi:hypothetical protein